MNDLYLIGNGFDLAHGLKTSYNDFLLWYLKESLQSCNSKSFFSDKLITIRRDGYQYSSLDNYMSLKELLGEMKRMNFSIKYNHDFFKNLVENYSGNKWVDIEYEYYLALIKLYKEIENSLNYSRDNLKSRLVVLNTCFDSIKGKLVEYLLSIKISSDLYNIQIKEILFEDTGTIDTRAKEQLESLLTNEKPKGEKLFICFNYTNTVELYLNDTYFKNDLIYIHGELSDLSNPIIFGYGDEMDPHYEKIENLNTNEFLKNMKSFEYFKTRNYQDIIRFVGSEKFTVKILGHSCGLSDRILLNTIFEHPNCKHIKIFHYEKSPTENDYFEKAQEISRHFKASKKGEMRLKIVPFDKYSAIPQNPKEN